MAAALDNIDADRDAPRPAAVVINPKTGAIEAMYSNPTYDPNPLVSQDIKTEQCAWRTTPTIPAAPRARSCPRHFQHGLSSRARPSRR